MTSKINKAIEEFEALRSEASLPGETFVVGEYGGNEGVGYFLGTDNGQCGIGSGGLFLAKIELAALKRVTALVDYANRATSLTAALKVALDFLAFRRYEDHSVALAEIERILVGDTPTYQRDTVDPLNDEEI